MIFINDLSLEFKEKLFGVCPISPYSARIAAYYTAYEGRRYSFIEFWIAENNGVIEAALCRYYSTMIVSGIISEETAEFIEMLAPERVFCDAGQLRHFKSGTFTKGETMVCTSPPVLKEELGFETVKLGGEMTPLKAVYELLSGEFEIGAFDDYFVDISHRIRHGVSDVYVVYENGEPISSLTVIAKTDTAAVLGAVITREDCRCRGIAGRLVKEITARLCSEGREVFLHREKNIGIYENAGFTPNGSWAEISFR